MLTINIPTFNKPKSVFKLLSNHQDIFKKYDIDINIFDNSSNNETKEIYLLFKNQINIKYYKNVIHLSADNNFNQAYSHNNKEYILLLGDTYKINDILFHRLMDVLSTNKYKIIIMNHASMADKIDIEFTNNNELLKKMCSIATCMSTLIFHKSIFYNNSYKKYLNTSFFHAGILYEYIHNNKFNALYIGNSSCIERNFIDNSLTTKLNWSYTNKVFDISIINWQKFLNILPKEYPSSLKKFVFNKFYKDLKIFNFKRLIFLRYKNIINLEFLQRYKINFYDNDYSLKNYYLKVYIFCLIPKSLCGLIVKISTLFYK